MPRVLPRCERGSSAVDEGTDPLPGVFEAISEGVRGLQQFVEEVDEDRISVSLPEVFDSTKPRDNCSRSQTSSSAVASGFDLAQIQVRLDTFISGHEDRLELEPLPKHQRKQVASPHRIQTLQALWLEHVGSLLNKDVHAIPLCYQLIMPALVFSYLKGLLLLNRSP